MLKIGLAYMDVSNLGDVAIYETARFLVEKILAEHRIKEYTFVPIDVGTFRVQSAKMNPVRMRLNLFGEWVLEHSTQGKSEKAAEKRVLRQWHLTKEYDFFKKNEMPKLDGLDMIIFCGGGLIKYHKQFFHFFLHEITQVADAKKIPVLINAVGVEGYDEHNPMCQLLKKAINRDCVKYISTRDDIQTLKNKYIVNPNIMVEAVCDPAIWSKEFYQVQPEKGSKKIGLGVIRPAIFKDYMYYVNRQRLMDMFFLLAKRITEAGYEVEFFSNGVQRDLDFVNMLMETYPSLKEKYNVSVATPSTPKELASTICSYDRFVAIRLHASIIACSLGVPNISLVWNIKQILFGQQIGLEQNYITKENFDDAYIFDQLMRAERPEIDPAYKQSVYQGLERAITGVLEGNENGK